MAYVSAAFVLALAVFFVWSGRRIWRLDRSRFAQAEAPALARTILPASLTALWFFSGGLIQSIAPVFTIVWLGGLAALIWIWVSAARSGTPAWAVTPFARRSPNAEGDEPAMSGR